ncbi:helix-turn-helix domain-containing protein [Streptomyces inhibens]|uniref:helix-turn-helix domain-containing protein n=1 Tax=Streptomyces inhibens TaxID=2293571 RepID=UPI0036A817F8
MPRWKALPEELDPQVREFAGQLRRLVDRNGLSVATVADRTGYSKTSWERYFNGRLLPPQRAVIALAEATGTHPGHLTTLWELAERAWSRSEMRHDVTMEAIRVAQARAALGEFDTEPAEAQPSAKPAKAAKSVRSADSAKDAQAAGGAQSVRVAEPQPMPPVPQQRSGELPSPADFPEWAQTAAQPPVTAAASSPAAAPVAGNEGRRARRSRAVMLTVGAAGALLVAVAAVLLLNPDTDAGTKTAAPEPAAAPSKQPVLPAGVRCAGAGCVGKDPEAMGCGGPRAVSPSRGLAGGAVIEVRYSSLCHTAWARISGAAPGDQATISAGGHSATARVERNGTAYTAMVEVAGDPAKVAACGTTMAGVKGCARPVPTTAAGPGTPTGPGTPAGPGTPTGPAAGAAR